MTTSMTIYERLVAMAVSANRVIDERTVPGAIRHELSAEQWVPVDRPPSGYFAMFVRPGSLGRGSHDSIVVVVTRFVFDHGVDPSELIDHAYVDARTLTGWQEASALRWPMGSRHSGWAQITGTYISDGAPVFTTSTYAVYERGNVGYLVHVTATVRDDSLTQSDRAEQVGMIQTVNFVD